MNGGLPIQLKYKKVLLVTVVTFLFIFSSGCIHVDLGNPFLEPEPKVTDYQIAPKEGFPLKHVFNIEVDSSTQFSETQPFYIEKGTEWFNISIIIVMNNYQYFNNSPINISFLEQYVKVTLTGPDDEIYYNTKFTESAEVIRPYDLPMTGLWIVAVEAKGFGYQGNYDSYEVNVVAYEPI